MKLNYTNNFQMDGSDGSGFGGEQPTSAPNLPEETFIIREINTDKYYWCKCENCGCEDSSEFCEGCHPIADTGDNTDPLCPVCGCNKLEGEPALIEPESYSGIVKVKIPFDAVIEPLKKTIKQQEKIIEDLRWSNSTPIGNLPVATPAPIREGVESAAQILSKHSEYTEDEILDSERILFGQDEILPAMEEYASQFTAPTGDGSVNTLLAEVLSKYIKYIRDVDGTDYILVHDERYASDVKFTDEQWQLLTDVAKKCD